MRALWLSTSVHSAKRSIQAIHPAVYDLWLATQVADPEDIEWVPAGPDTIITGYFEYAIIDADISDGHVEHIVASTRGTTWRRAPHSGREDT